ncbi:hypothetical protein ACP70R_019526 [Stipagrostis hirtigluma subsp. patula]
MAGERRWSGAAAADAAWWCCVVVLVVLLVAAGEEHDEHGGGGGGGVVVRGARLGTRACEEMYVVAEGETLHSISARCGDPDILERNPHVHDPDDVFPGLDIRITPRATHP